jgi:hypothetical protein
MNRKRPLILAAGVLVATAITAVAWASIPGSNGVYTACMLKGVGTIRLIDKSLPSTNLMSHCTDKEAEVSWNQAGQPGPAGLQGAMGDPGAPGTNGTNGSNGKDGSSVTTASEPAGANCADGGVQLNAANGVSYVCNGKNGTDGKDGADGNGLSTLADLDGLPCTIPPGSTPGVVHVHVDDGSSTAVVGAVSLRCEPIAGTTVLDLAVSAHCTGAFGTCGPDDEASLTDGPHTCSVTATVPGVTVADGCTFAYVTGTEVRLTATTPANPIWGGACAGVAGTVCSLTLTGSSMDVSLRY